MGYDIHFHVEKRTEDGWVRAEPMAPNEYADLDGEPAEVRESFYDWRSYHTYGLLAGVRRVDLDPIAPPRGLPDDLSDEVRAEAEDWGSDGHTHSWLSLAELETFDWDGQHFASAVHRMAEVAKVDSLDHSHVRAVFWFDN